MSIILPPCGDCGGPGVEIPYKFRAIYHYTDSLPCLPPSSLGNLREVGVGSREQYGSWGWYGFNNPFFYGSINDVTGLPADAYLKFTSVDFGGSYSGFCTVGTTVEYTSKWDESTYTVSSGFGAANGYCYRSPTITVLSDACDLIKTDFDSVSWPSTFSSSGNIKRHSVNSSGTFSTATEAQYDDPKTDNYGPKVFGSWWNQAPNWNFSRVKLEYYSRRIEIELIAEAYVYVWPVYEDTSSIGTNDIPIWMIKPGGDTNLFGVTLSDQDLPGSTIIETSWGVMRADPSDYTTYYADTTSKTFPIGTRLRFDMPTAGTRYAFTVVSGITAGCP